MNTYCTVDRKVMGINWPRSVSWFMNYSDGTEETTKSQSG